MIINPKHILLFSGKRKSGKDYLTEKLHKLLLPRSVIIRLSAPIKYHWAQEHNLDYDKLLGDGAYKEKYRAMMAEWGIQKRTQEPGYFCVKAIDMVSESKTSPIWIVSDLRYTSDLIWFKENFDKNQLHTVRVITSNEVRKNRGWVSTPGIDDMATECDLDDWIDWDFVIENNTGDDSDQGLTRLVDLCSDTKE